MVLHPLVDLFNSASSSTSIAFHFNLSNFKTLTVSPGLIAFQLVFVNAAFTCANVLLF